MNFAEVHDELEDDEKGESRETHCDTCDSYHGSFSARNGVLCRPQSLCGETATSAES